MNLLRSLAHGWFATAVLFPSASALAAAAPAPGAPLFAFTKDFLSRHCLECHDADTQKGKVRLDNLAPNFTSPVSAETWGKVFSQLEKREMPPKKKPQPTDAERQTVLNWLERELRVATAARQAAEGRVAWRRLNRTEYQNTIHDLFGIEVNVLELLPEDALAHGFDKLSTALTLSPVQMENIWKPPTSRSTPRSASGRRRSFCRSDTRRRTWWRTGIPNRCAGWPTAARWCSSTPAIRRRKRRSSARRLRGVIASASRRAVFKRPVRRPSSGCMAAASAWAARRSCSGISRCRRTPPATVELVARLDGRGDTLKVVPYATIPWQNAGATYTGPGLAVQWIEVEGPLEAVGWPPATRGQLLGDADLEKGTLANAASVLRRFAPRAFRRPVSDADLAPYLQLVSERLEKGVKFADALRVGLKAVLVSPRFLKFNDAAVISDIVRRVKAKEHGFRTLIHEITASTTFQTK